MVGDVRQAATSLRVDAEGLIVEALDSARHPLPVRSLDELIELAQALLRSDSDALNFVHIGPANAWLAVSLIAERGRSRPTVMLELRPIEPPFGVTVRELDVMTLIAAGFGNDTIAACLEISRRTVDKHVENLFSKTQTWTRAGVAGLAVDRGLLRFPIPGRSRTFPLSIGAVMEIARRAKHERPPVRQTTRQPIMVGMPLPLHSQGQADAMEMLDGAQLAVDQLNQRGGVLDREIKLVTIDCDITDPLAMKRAITELAERDVAAITMGYSYADPSVFQVASDYRAPLLHAATLDYVVNWVREDPGRFSNVFQTCASDIKYGQGLARFLSWLITTAQWSPRNRRIAVVQPPWPGLDIGLSELELRLVGKGWDIQTSLSANSAERNWNVVVAELKKFDPCVVLFASYMVEDSIEFQKAFVKSPFPALIYKLYSPSVPVYRETLGPDCDGVLWATTTGLYSDEIGAHFRSSFQSAYSRNPGRSHAGIAYDRINMLAGAWSRVGTPWNFGRVVGDLRSSIHRGVNGAYYFGNSGQVGLTFPDDTLDPSISQAHLVFQLQQGRQRIISPTPYAEGVFQLPRWLTTRSAD
jgi:branched-chain amino acid transport system substrate-binding protein